MENNLQKIGNRIKNLREEKNYSQDYLAQRLGISQKAYSKIENSQTKLTVEHLLKIADALEVSINKILASDGNTVHNNFSTHNGEGIVVNKATSEKLVELYEKLLASKDNEIKILTELIQRDKSDE